MLSRHVSHRHQNASRRENQVRYARSGPRASQACQACASAKARCDNGVQCKRCTRRRITCIRQHPVLGSSIETDLPQDDRSQLPVYLSPAVSDSRNSPTRASFGEFPLIPGTQMAIASQTSASDPSDETSIPPTQWDFSTMHNLFDFGSDIDFLRNEPGDNLHASITHFLAKEPELMSSTTSIVSKLNGSASDIVFDAFQQSVGRWTPKRHHYRAVQEHHLSLGRMVPSKLDCLGACDLQVFTEVLPPSIRDQILSLIVRSCENDDFMNAISAFPTVEILDRLLKSFFTQHASLTDSWIHIPTFQIPNARLELLIACIAGAAVMSPSRPVQNFGLAIQEFLVFQLWSMSEKSNDLIRDLQFLQAVALHVEIALWSGVKRKMEWARSFLNILINSIRGGNHFRRTSYSNPFPDPDDESEVLEAKWKQWVQEESFKRLVYHAYVHCSQESIFTSGTTPISYSELSLPLPQARKLWFAKSSQEWKDIYLKLEGTSQSRPPCLPDLLADPRASKGLSPTYDIHLSQISVLYAVSSMIRRYRQDKSVFSAKGHSDTRVNVLSDEAQLQQILHILTEIKSNYETEEHPYSTELNLIHGLLTMHLFAPFDQMESAAGREGQIEAQRTYPILKQWTQTDHARQAVWHASQVVRAARMLPPDYLLRFYAVAAYHASLCLWIYGVFSPETTGFTSMDHNNVVVLDDEESIKSQRWINQNRGFPVISNGGDGLLNGDTVQIRSTQTLIHTLLQSVLSRFSEKSSLLVQNIIILMRAIGNICQNAEGEGDNGGG
ncbi:hypothetical protein DL95DRAFT_437099 [Leptodontidium sp. 2 PMI_412]|nr:hypothetical protein DL95DRAFT_437099 [Leptodontidium sp. 2 PMI_412]